MKKKQNKKKNNDKKKNNENTNKSQFFVVSLGFCVVFAIIGIIIYNMLTFTVAEEPQPSAPQEEVATAAPDFKVFDETGEEVYFSSFSGKPVLIYTWGTWNNQCRNELPYYENAWKKYGDKIEFMMVNLTGEEIETEDKAKAYVDEKGYTFPVYYDRERNVMSFAYEVLDVPLTVLVDESGMVAKQWTDEITEEKLFEYIDSLLGE